MSSAPDPRAVGGSGLGPVAPIRIVVADDQSLIRSGLVSLLQREPDFDVVADVGRGDEVLDACLAHTPHVAVLDLEMPGIDGLEACRQVKEKLPDTRVLIVTMYGRPGYVRRAGQSGAEGFLIKDTPIREFAEAIRQVHAGYRVIDPSLAAASVFAGESPLSARETEVLQVAGEGISVAAIAHRLSLSEGTVRNHLSAAIRKTETESRAQAFWVAEQKGWL
jgi:two-component system response regulator DesR